MEIKLTIELEKPKDADCDLVLAAAEEIFRPLVEELKEAGSKAAYPLVSTHSNWALEVEESDWDYDFYGSRWYSNVSIYLRIAEVDSGDVVDEYLAWELLGEPLDKKVFEPLHSCDWSKLQGREEEGISLQFSSLQVINSSKGDGLYFHYDVQCPRLLPQPPQ
jgi:hypothetical protein